MTLRVFLLCLAAGLGCGAADGLLTPARKAAGTVFTVLSDILLALVSVGSHATVLFFVCDGQFFFYALSAQTLGFAVARAPVLRLLHALRKKFPPRPHKQKQPAA